MGKTFSWGGVNGPVSGDAILETAEDDSFLSVGVAGEVSIFGLVNSSFEFFNVNRSETPSASLQLPTS